MSFANFISENDFPQVLSPIKDNWEPFLTEISKSKSKAFFLDLSQNNSFCSTSTSDSGRSESSREDSKFVSKHQVTLERRHRNFQVKKKTELCKTFQLGMVCPYGSKCSFAHGVEELRGKLLVPTNYKTINCKQYYEQGYCNYGPRCQFVHKLNTGKVEIPPITIGYDKIYQAMLTAYDYDVCNGLDKQNIAGFLNQRVNPTRFGLSRLQVFEDCGEEY